MIHSNEDASPAEKVAAVREEHELEEIVSVLGDNVAQRCAERHILANLVEATQVGYWAA